MPLKPGDRVELLRRTRIAPDSLVALSEGDTGRVVRVGPTTCVVDFCGVLVVVRTRDLAHAGSVVWWG